MYRFALRLPFFGLKHDSKPLYLSHSLKTFAEALMGIYIPIFILTLKNLPVLVSNPIVNGLIFVLVFYIIRSITAVFLMTDIINLIFGTFNFKKSILLGNIFLAIGLITLSLSTNSLIFLLLAPMALAIDTIFYWVPYHLFFIRKASDGHGNYGFSFGLRTLLTNISAALGPIAGGIIISFLGFNALFVIGTMIILIAAIPILLTVHEDSHGKHNAHHIFEKCISNPALRNDTIAITALEMEGLLYAIFWPVVLFTIAASFTKVGFITSVSIAISSIMALVVGELVDKYGARKIHFIGVILNCLNYFPKLFVGGLLGVYLIDIADKMFGNLYGVPFTAVMYKHARDKIHDSDFIIFRAMIIHAAAAMICILSIVLIIILPSWRYIFMLSAAISPFAYLINKPKAVNQ